MGELIWEQKHLCSTNSETEADKEGVVELFMEAEALVISLSGVAFKYLMITQLKMKKLLYNNIQ